MLVLRVEDFLNEPRKVVKGVLSGKYEQLRNTLLHFGRPTKVQYVCLLARIFAFEFQHDAGAWADQTEGEKGPRAAT